MALLEVLKYPDPFLKTRAEKIEEIDDNIRKLVADMLETMYAERGIGLAAVQVKVDKRVIVLDVPSEEDLDKEPGERESNRIVLINPEIVEAEGSIKFDEGCLSVPGVTAEVERASRVRVRALDAEGTELEFDAEGLFAIALQHETDHLDGMLFIDRLSRFKKELVKRRIKKVRAAEETEETEARVL